MFNISFILLITETYLCIRSSIIFEENTKEITAVARVLHVIKIQINFFDFFGLENVNFKNNFMNQLIAWVVFQAG